MVCAFLAPTLEVDLRCVVRVFLPATFGVDDLDMILASRYAAIVAVRSNLTWIYGINVPHRCRESRAIKLGIHDNPDGKYLIKGGGPKVLEALPTQEGASPLARPHRWQALWSNGEHGSGCPGAVAVPHAPVLRRNPGFEFYPLLEGRRPPPGSLRSLLVRPETDLDFLLIEDFFASIVIFSQEAS